MDNRVKENLANCLTAIKYCNKIANHLVNYNDACINEYSVNRLNQLKCEVIKWVGKIEC